MTDLNIEQARFNMIEQQIRPWDVLDMRVLELIERTPREEFVPDKYRQMAFCDLEIPLGHDQEMMPPRVEARMLQALNVHSGDKALEIGTGSGHVTALLAGMAEHVYSVDIIGEFTTAATERLAKHELSNVTLETGDAATGWDKHAPYDVIAVTGSLPVLTEDLQKSLTVGGRLFVIVGDAPVMQARLITRLGENEWDEQCLFETVIPPLQNAPQPQRFVL